jgi:hypothetical protein
MGLLARILRPSGLSHGRPPCNLLLSPGDMVPMVPNLINPQVRQPSPLVLHLFVHHSHPFQCKRSFLGFFPCIVCMFFFYMLPIISIYEHIHVNKLSFLVCSTVTDSCSLINMDFTMMVTNTIVIQPSQPNMATVSVYDNEFVWGC